MKKERIFFDAISSVNNDNSKDATLIELKDKIDFFKVLMLLVQNRTIFLGIKNLINAIGKENTEKLFQNSFGKLERFILKYQRTKTVKKMLSFMDFKKMSQNSSIVDELLDCIKTFRAAYDVFFTEITELLESLDICYVILKGKAVEHYYRNDIDRDILDIDIFIKDENEFYKFIKALSKKGYSFDHINVRNLGDYRILEMSTFSKTSPYISLDIHNGTSQTSGDCYFDSDIWADRVKTFYNNDLFMSSTTENHINMIFAHAIHHGVVRKRDINDFYFLIKKISVSGLDESVRITKENLFNVYFNNFVDTCEFNEIPHLSENVIMRIFYTVMKRFAIEQIYFFDFPFKVHYSFMFWVKRKKPVKAVKNIFGESIRFILYFSFAITKLIPVLSWFSSFLVYLENQFRNKKKITSYRYDYHKGEESNEISLTTSEIIKLISDKTILYRDKASKRYYLNTPIGNYFRCNFKGKILS